MPKDFKLDGYEDIKPFSYVRVDGSSVEIKGKDYKYPQKVLDEYVPIMTVDWEQYKEEQSVSDLKDEGDFLLYFEQIVLKEKDNKPVTTSRGSSGSGLKSNGKGDSHAAKVKSVKPNSTKGSTKAKKRRKR